MLLYDICICMMLTANSRQHQELQKIRQATESVHPRYLLSGHYTDNGVHMFMPFPAVFPGWLFGQSPLPSRSPPLLFP